MELSGTSEAAREAFSAAILLLSKLSTRTDTSTVEKATGLVAATAAKAASARTEAAAAGAITSAVAPTGLGRTQGGASEASEIAVGSASALRNVGSPGNGSTALVPLAQPPSLAGGVSSAEARGGSARAEAAAAGDGERPVPSVVDARARHRGVGADAGGVGAGILLSPSAQREQAIQALVGVMRGLENRFVARTSTAPPSQRLLSAQEPTLAESMDARSDATGTSRVRESGAASTPAATKSAAGSKGAAGGWAVRVRPSRAEELLSDLLEREKASLSQVSRDGTRALERRAAAACSEEPVPPNATAPPFFLARTSPAATTAAVAAPATPVVVALAGGRSPATNKDIQLLLRQRRRQHFPLELSSAGLGEKNSVFSMMLRGASLLGRHETAVLLAVRGAEHFLESFDVLASPRGPLGLGGVGGGAGSPGTGSRRGGVGGNGNEGLGAVHLLLTTRAPGADRRRLDTAVTSACAEFLAYALAVVLWAVPFTARQELFGDNAVGGHDAGSGDGGGAVNERGRATVARRASVQRCLARLMKHSMRSDSTRVRRAVEATGARRLERIRRRQFVIE